MTTKFESANYYQFSSSINDLLATGLYSGVKITIYDNEDGSIIHTGDNGVVLDDKEIVHLKKRDPYIDYSSSYHIQSNDYRFSSQNGDSQSITYLQQNYYEGPYPTSTKNYSNIKCQILNKEWKRISSK